MLLVNWQLCLLQLVDPEGPNLDIVIRFGFGKRLRLIKYVNLLESVVQEVCCVEFFFALVGDDILFECLSVEPSEPVCWQVHARVYAQVVVHIKLCFCYLDHYRVAAEERKSKHHDEAQEDQACRNSDQELPIASKLSRSVDVEMAGFVRRESCDSFNHRHSVIQNNVVLVCEFKLLFKLSFLRCFNRPVLFNLALGNGPAWWLFLDQVELLLDVGV